MSSVARKIAARDLATSAYNLQAGVLHGQLRRSVDGRDWLVGETPLETWLEQYSQQEIYLIVASLEDSRPLVQHECRTCGTVYEGGECPRCREVRRRLRGG